MLKLGISRPSLSLLIAAVSFFRFVGAASAHDVWDRCKTAPLPIPLWHLEFLQRQLVVRPVWQPPCADPAKLPTSGNFTADFGGATPGNGVYTVTVVGNQAVGTMNFNNGGYTITGGSLTLIWVQSRLLRRN